MNRHFPASRFPPLPRAKFRILAGIATLAALCTGLPALADVKDGVDAWERGDYANALREWRGPAEKGDPDALFNMAQAHKLGQGVPQDLAKAEDLFGQAAARGHLQAADYYGLLLFERGERELAMPFIRAAADRGEPRAQYLLGIAHFNGDGVPVDWVRAYALVSLARQAGVEQAIPALVEMDKYIPLNQRQQSVPLASSLAAQADAKRVRQLVAADLNSASTVSPAPVAASSPPKPGDGASPATAGADYTSRPKGASTSPSPAAVAPNANPAPTKPPSPAKATIAPAAAPQPAKKPAPAPVKPAAGTNWKLQLGAFGVPGNAQALWRRLEKRPELAGHTAQFVKSGNLTLLQAGGFASRAEAQAACKKLGAAGFDCLPSGK